MRLLLAYTLVQLSTLIVCQSSFQYEKFVDVWSSYYVVPRALLNEDDLETVGLAEFAKFGRRIEMQSLGRAFTINALNDDRPIFIPQNASLMFLFNTTSKLEPPTMGGDVLSEQFIQTSLPFGLPQYHYVEDSFLLVPKKYNLPLTSADVWLDRLGFDRSQIPLSRELLNSPDQSIMTFVLQCGESSRLDQKAPFSTKNLSNSTTESYWLAKKRISDVLYTSSSEVAKAVIASSEEFFDNFARLWINNLGYDTLLNSLFCQVNTKIHELSYCLRINQRDVIISLVSRDPTAKWSQNIIEKNTAQGPRLERRQNDFDEEDVSYDQEEEMDDPYDDDDCGEDDDDESHFQFIHDLKYQIKKKAIMKLHHVVELLQNHLPDCDEEEYRYDDEDDCGEDTDTFGEEPTSTRTVSSLLPPITASPSVLTRTQRTPPPSPVWLNALTKKLEEEEYYGFDSENDDYSLGLLKRTVIPSIALRAKTRISNAGKALHEKLDFSKLNVVKSPDKDDEIKLEEEDYDDDDGVGLVPYLSIDEGLFKRGFKSLFTKQDMPEQPVTSQANEQPCTEITWKKVFEHSLYGEAPNFCTQKKTI